MKDTDDINCLSEEEEEKWREIHEMGSSKYRELCPYCGRRQYKIVRAPEQIAVQLWRWNTSCYACKKLTPVVWPIKDLSGFTWESMRPDTFKNLPQAIEQEYPFFKIVSKKIMDVIEHGNTCVHCGAYQRDWFVIEEYLEIAYEPETVDEIKDIFVNLIEDERLYYANPRIKFKMHHPRKGEYKDLCPDCFSLYKKGKIV